MVLPRSALSISAASSSGQRDAGGHQSDRPGIGDGDSQAPDSSVWPKTTCRWAAVGGFHRRLHRDRARPRDGTAPDHRLPERRPTAARVIHPAGLATQLKGGSVQGLEWRCLEHMVYDPQNGLPATVGLHQAETGQRISTCRSRCTPMRSTSLNRPVALGTKGVGERTRSVRAAATLAVRDFRCARRARVQPHASVAASMIVNFSSGTCRSRTSRCRSITF